MPTGFPGSNRNPKIHFHFATFPVDNYHAVYAEDLAQEAISFRFRSLPHKADHDKSEQSSSILLLECQSGSQN